MTVPNRAALACFAAAAAWPIAMGGIANALMSPLERAMRTAWCGVPYHAASEILGHCAACWAGSLVLAATGLWLMMRTRAQQTAPLRQLSIPSRWP